MSNIKARLICILVLLALAASPSFTPIQAATLPASTSKCISYYVVKNGDNLEDLAIRLGVETQDLADSNNLSTDAALGRGRLLCIPYPHGYWQYRNATLYASFITTNRIVVWGSNFPKKHSFFVNIRTQKGAAYTRVNKIQASKTGDVQAYIRIPKSLMKSRPTVEVCLKDIKTSYRICAFARR
jgi:hypothetical protein